MAFLVFQLSNRFHKLLFYQEPGVEPILIVDHIPTDFPKRLFIVRYVVGEGGGGESKRPIFKNELTGYDYETRMTYPTQDMRLESLQSTMESSMYGASDALLSKANVQNVVTREYRLVKVIVSDDLVSRLVGLYDFAW